MKPFTLFIILFNYFIYKILPEAGRHTTEHQVPCWVNPPPDYPLKKKRYPSPGTQ